MSPPAGHRRGAAYRRRGARGEKSRRSGQARRNRGGKQRQAAATEPNRRVPQEAGAAFAGRRSDPAERSALARAGIGSRGGGCRAIRRIAAGDRAGRRAAASAARPAGGRTDRASRRPAPAAPSDGLSLKAVPGATVVAPFDGRIVYAGPFRDLGRVLIIRHDRRYYSALAGLARVDAKVGDWVLAGEPVGAMPGAPSATLRRGRAGVGRERSRRVAVLRAAPRRKPGRSPTVAGECRGRARRAKRGAEGGSMKQVGLIAAAAGAVLLVTLGQGAGG